MASDAQIPAPLREPGGFHDHETGLTLVEVMISCAMICITCTTFMYVFAQLNQMAMVSRLYTGAYAVAQSQIDLISTDSPFQPGAATPQVPPELVPGTTSTPVTVYQDPVTDNTVSGTMTTTVATANTSYTSGATTETLYLYRATVTVSYTYRNQSYSVSFSTLRTSDV
jgi:type II secretory pathway pseudopilin PulG